MRYHHLSIINKISAGCERSDLIHCFNIKYIKIYSDKRAANTFYIFFFNVGKTVHFIIMCTVYLFSFSAIILPAKKRKNLLKLIIIYWFIRISILWRENIKMCHKYIYTAETVYNDVQGTKENRS